MATPIPNPIFTKSSSKVEEAMYVETSKETLFSLQNASKRRLEVEGSRCNKMGYFVSSSKVRFFSLNESYAEEAIKIS